jgi:hypothetical protein
VRPSLPLVLLLCVPNKSYSPSISLGPNCLDRGQRHSPVQTALNEASHPTVHTLPVHLSTSSPRPRRGAWVRRACSAVKDATLRVRKCSPRPAQAARASCVSARSSSLLPCTPTHLIRISGCTRTRRGATGESARYRLVHWGSWWRGKGWLIRCVPRSSPLLPSSTSFAVAPAPIPVRRCWRLVLSPLSLVFLSLGRE